MKRITGLLLLAGVALLVFFLTRELYRPAGRTEQVTSDVLLERVRPVLKLTTVEGDFMELYTYRDNSAAWFDWSKDLPWNQKKAILRVKARASVGYDLEGLHLEFDEHERVVRLLGMDRPKLLALEHDVDYYDLEEGAFNRFTAADHSRINAQAKEMVRGKVERSGLLKEAEAQRDELLTVLKAVVESAGWQFDDRVSQPELRPADR
ncbi:MAG: DUF4230 domain-containing protein [Flavobacteriales bacterium]|nr:DUF4230 domain-containing protein [Flavobacteriales bacterium]